MVRPPSSSRRFALNVALLGAGLLVVALGLVSWLLVGSLSRGALQDILLETEREAEGLADRIAGQAQREGQDLFTAIALERETQTYIDTVLRKRDIVQSVEIRDAEGVVVLRSIKQASVENPLAPQIGSPETPGVAPDVVTRTFETPSTYDVRVPIADLGELHIGISRGQMEERIGVLRRHLLRQVGLTLGVALALMGVCGAFAYFFWRRSERFAEQAAESERMAYVGTLASGLAHEIRNPLNSLNLNMQLLEEELTAKGALEARAASGAGSGGRLFEITRSEIARLEQLVTDFLTYARPRALDLELVSAATILERAAAVLRPELEAKGTRLQVVDRSEGVALRVDPAQLQQLMLNLMRNAVQAVEAAGRSPRITLGANSVGSRVHLEVSDNGLGIAKEHRKKVFDVFYSTRKGGTGLGLAIVERIARAHGGEVEIESAPESGTTVRVDLPAEPRRLSDGPGGRGLPLAPLDPLR